MPTNAVPAIRASTFALSEHPNLRIFVLFLLYFAQGMPFGLFQVAIPAWLAQNGASAAEIGAGCCQSNRNRSPVGIATARRSSDQVMRTCHSAKATERWAL